MNARAEKIHDAETPFQPENPQPLLREISGGEAYPVAALGPLRQVVEAVLDITRAPFAIAAQSALAVASLAVQGFADVETLGGDAPCSLFCLAIAESGEAQEHLRPPSDQGYPQVRAIRRRELQDQLR